MISATNTVFTIGHSTHSLEAFVALLQQHGVTALADVRSAPFSRFNPQFNRDTLKTSLISFDIRYVFLGRELGGRSDDPTCYENGRVRYTQLARTNLFLEGIERVIHGARGYCVALMCAEKEPLECHRTLLVAPVLAKSGITVLHILANGSLESHEAAMDRLLDLVGLPHIDLFSSRDELIAEAIDRQERRVAYTDAKWTANT